MTAQAFGAALHAVTARWGVRHGGAFAAEYRRQFGELPSETLRGRGRGGPPRIVSHAP